MLVSSGMQVKNGDALQVANGARATLVCSNASTRNFNQGTHRIQCSAARPVIIYNKSRLSRVRAGENEPFPILISPRMTTLLDPHPTIRWKPVSGIIEYQIIVKNGAKAHWVKNVNGISEIKYPEDAPALQSGQSYSVVIVAANERSSNDEKAVNAGFSILDSNEIGKVRKITSQIEGLSISQNMKHFLKATVYASWKGNDSEPDAWRLTAEAIEILENLSKTEESPATLLKLGDLYLTIKIAFLAEKKFLRALELSKAAKDVLNEAAAELALGRVYQARLNKNEAKRRLKAAETIYETVGEQELVKEVQEEIKALGN